MTTKSPHGFWQQTGALSVNRHCSTRNVSPTAFERKILRRLSDLQKKLDYPVASITTEFKSVLTTMIPPRKPTQAISMLEKKIRGRPYLIWSGNVGQDAKYLLGIQN